MFLPVTWQGNRETCKFYSSTADIESRSVAKEVKLEADQSDDVIRISPTFEHLDKQGPGSWEGQGLLLEGQGLLLEGQGLLLEG